MKLGVVMDPIGSIHYEKDSTLAMLFEAQARGWEIYYMEQADLWVEDGRPYAQRRRLEVFRDPQRWYAFGPVDTAPLAELDVVLMRKDPPFDTQYIYTTYLLERAEEEGLLVVNRARSLRDINEKCFIAWFAELAPPMLIARSAERLRAFLERHGEVVFKPLGAMAGTMVFRVRRDDPNVNVIIETLTRDGHEYAMAQRYLPEVTETGDKRILLVDGEPVPYALARLPAPGESRANLARGGRGLGVPLTSREREICATVGPVLRRRGVLFAGLDVIGDHLTEINVTSPTGIRELDKLFGLNIAAELLNTIERTLAGRGR
jgi:glutathione synthase